MISFKKHAAAASLTVVLLFSCKPDSKTINIKGDIKGLHAEMAYLSSTYPVGSKPIDSAKVINGKFEFNIHTDTVFQPFLGHITYRGNPAIKNCCGVINPNSPDKNKPERYFDFYIEPGPMLLSGDLTVDKYGGLTLKAGPQNDFYFKYLALPFTRPGKDIAKHRLRVEYLEKIVTDNPGAYPAMFTLHSWQFNMTNKELRRVFDKFDDDVKRSEYGRSVKSFFEERPDPNALKVNESVIDTAGKISKLIDTTKRLNMIVFWASWCGPCKLEIPGLKKLAAREATNSDLRMISVSIDQDKHRWKNEVRKQQMGWPQFAFSTSVLSKALAHYNLNLIPQIYFIDNHRKLITKIEGYDPANEASIEDLIKKNLN
ncbi:MAG TPA: TlpA disulfide reductase family protein [Mucilaginibacter sp.]